MVTETPIDTIGFRLGTQELLYVLNVLELKTLPSLGPDPLRDVSEEQKQQILAAGFNSLRAREWVKLTSDPQHPVIMESVFVTPFLVCAGAPKMLSVTRQRRGQPTDQVFLFQTQDVLVSHRIPEAGVHEFVITGVRENLAKLTSDFLELPKILPAPETGRFSLPAGLVKNFMDAVSKSDLPLMEKILVGVEGAKPYSSSLLNCLKNLKQTTVILMADFPEKMTSVEQVSGKTISILNSDEMAWQIENNAQNDLLFSQTSSEQAKELIHAWAFSLANTQA